MKEERNSDKRQEKRTNEDRKQKEQKDVKKKAGMKVWKDETRYERNKEIIEGNLNRVEKRVE